MSRSATRVAIALAASVALSSCTAGGGGATSGSATTPPAAPLASSSAQAVPHPVCSTWRALDLQAKHDLYSKYTDAAWDSRLLDAVSVECSAHPQELLSTAVPTAVRGITLPPAPSETPTDVVTPSSPSIPSSTVFDDFSAGGAFKEGLQTSMTAPSTVGAVITLDPFVSNNSTLLLRIHVSGWVPRLADGDAFAGLEVGWGDGLYTHGFSGGNCVDGGQWVDLDYTYQVVHRYVTPGTYTVVATTGYCASAHAYESTTTPATATATVKVGP